MNYSSDLVNKYSQNRHTFNETDNVLIETLEKIGVTGKDVLDLGCGDGRHSKLMKASGARSVLGIDISEKMNEKFLLKLVVY